MLSTDILCINKKQNLFTQTNEPVKLSIHTLPNARKAEKHPQNPKNQSKTAIVCA